MAEPDGTYVAWGLDGGVHEARDLKSMLTPEEQVDLLKAKGVTFERCDEQTAIEALMKKNTFLHIASYRKLFQRHRDGDKAGQYVRLDFADLLDMNCLDDEIRGAFRLITGDIERMVKTSLVARISGMAKEDGYGIVAEFMESQSRAYRKSIERNLELRAGPSGRTDVYLGSLIAHYSEAIPVWVFLEVVPFGTLLAFYLFCAGRWDDHSMKLRHSMLTEAKAVRNCCSHGACIVNGFAEGKSSGHETPHMVIEWLVEHGFKSSKSRRAKMGNRRTQQLVTCIAVWDSARGDASPSTTEALVQLEGLLRDRTGCYGQENSFVSYLLFIARAIDSMG